MKRWKNTAYKNKLVPAISEKDMKKARKAMPNTSNPVNWLYRRHKKAYHSSYQNNDHGYFDNFDT